MTHEKKEKYIIYFVCERRHKYYRINVFKGNVRSVTEPLVKHILRYKFKHFCFIFPLTMFCASE